MVSAGALRDCQVECLAFELAVVDPLGGLGDLFGGTSLIYGVTVLSVSGNGSSDYDLFLAIRRFRIRIVLFGLLSD